MMNDIFLETGIGDIIQDRERLRGLLALEKQRRGIETSALVFVGMHNVAQHWWCTQSAVLKSRANELMFFAVYLHDRIVYAHRLGLTDELPRRQEALLNIGSDLTWNDVEKLLKKEASEPDKHKVDQERAGRLALMNELEQDPFQRGVSDQALHAEKHLSIRWNFRWGRYSVVGMPDGITEEFVYEYKNTRNRYLLRYAKPVALAQADLYGYFFQRPKKRVQIRITEEDKIETYEELIDIGRAEETLAAFAQVDEGKPARPPVPWKCRCCEFRAECPISQAKA
ncbi:MAG: hypothetical protein AB1435_05005 [Chloroflexota bacterium]|jgi:CRISPR/Cas system-associated exonuclease Cas4 (RecB family)